MIENKISILRQIYFSLTWNLNKLGIYPVYFLAQKGSP